MGVEGVSKCLYGDNKMRIITVLRGCRSMANSSPSSSRGWIEEVCIGIGREWLAPASCERDRTPCRWPRLMGMNFTVFLQQIGMSEGAGYWERGAVSDLAGSSGGPGCCTDLR